MSEPLAGAGRMSEEQRERIRAEAEAATDWVGTFRCCGEPFQGSLREARETNHVCKETTKDKSA
jgi:hypothetical protein